eukprot:jgi/Botrbrau1/20971/Bobra.0655s0001.1
MCGLTLRCKTSSATPARYSEIHLFWFQNPLSRWRCNTYHPERSLVVLPRPIRYKVAQGAKMDTAEP